MPAPASDVTPARVSYLNGEVSFWRPGGQEWTPAKVNMPLAPGDLLYTGQGGNVEIQVGQRAFLRASEGTHVGLDNQEPDFVQFRVTAGHAALDLRELTAAQTVELDTPHGAFTVERTGYYHVEVSQESTAFDTHRGGSATVTPAGGAATPVAANQQVVITGTDSPRVEMAAAPALSAWDRWNYQRTDYLLQPASTRYVSPAVYGGEALNQYGSWRPVETYGSVWVPAGVSPDWVPYSTGRWIWDPRFGWTWLDDAPWGWAPYHYGRWVFLGNYWAWAPGPVVVRPAYAPALVVFLGGGGAVTVGRPLYWAPLGWGEPVFPWWGRPGFVGVAWWGGWGGPRVVNNVVVNRTTNINVTNITVYRNVQVTNAVVGVPAERFGQGQVQPTRISQAQAQQLTPVRGALAVRPIAASVQPATGSAAPPPAAIQARPVVATRAPHDLRPALQAQGLAATPAVAPTAPPRLVPSPRSAPPSTNAAVAPGASPARTPSGALGVAGPTVRGPLEKKGSAAEQASPVPPSGSPKAAPTQSRDTMRSDFPTGSGVPSPRSAPPSPNAAVAPGAGPARTPSAAPAVAGPTVPGPVEKKGSTAERASPPPTPGSSKVTPPQPRDAVHSDAPTGAGSEPRKDKRVVATPERGPAGAIAAARSTQEGMASRQTPPPPPPPPVTQNGASRRAREEPRANHPGPATAPTDRPAHVEPPTRGER
ncbi:MAG TPA: DUF6600 domain-containing protein [Methylomirabilota bacterium]|nr:DUF6600 domain-containing protein [Methylomirabilota bacterium]